MKPIERPILFSGPMVRAILDGRKTMTRRVMIAQAKLPPARYIEWTHADGSPAWAPQSNSGKMFIFLDWQPIKCRYGGPGDRLWVRQTWLLRSQKTVPVYRSNFADSAEAAGFGAMYGGWKPSIFMPRWASRITLEIVSVRVERLQEISKADVLAEGTPMFNGGQGASAAEARAGFQDLWNQINQKRGHGWEVNDFLWVITFKLLEGHPE